MNLYLGLLLTLTLLPGCGTSQTTLQISKHADPPGWVLAPETTFGVGAVTGCAKVVESVPEARQVADLKARSALAKISATMLIEGTDSLKLTESSGEAREGFSQHITSRFSAYERPPLIVKEALVRFAGWAQYCIVAKH